jgi:hypothetical protein
MREKIAHIGEVNLRHFFVGQHNTNLRQISVDLTIRNSNIGVHDGRVNV